MKKDTILHRIGSQIVRLGRTVSPLEADRESAWGGLRNSLTLLRSLLLLLILTLSAGTAWGQLPDGDGYYYITSNSDGTYYLCPAGASYVTYDVNQPYLTTAKTGEMDGSLWMIQYIETENKYHIKHYVDNKYLTHNLSKSNNASRLRVHLQSEDGGDNSLFSISENVTKIYNIVPKGQTDGLNPANGNKDSDVGVNSSSVTINGKSYYVGGMIGLYGVGDGNSKWKLKFVKKCVTPEIRVSPNGEVTITSVTSGATIYYTTDGTTPTATPSMAYASTFTISGTTTVKAIAIKDTFTDSDVAEQTFDQTTAPTFDQTNCDNTIAINCADAGATIVYTTDGNTPTSSSTVYTGPFVPETGVTVKAAAYVDGVSYLSNVATLSSYAPVFTVTPSITVTGNTVSISGPGSVYYTIDGNDPVVGNISQLYTEPYTFPEGSGSVIVKAIAKDGSLEASCIAKKAFVVAIVISDAAGIAGIADHPDYSYKVSANIDVSGLTASISGFTGTFDGDYYTISGLTKPLFTNLNGGTVKNVRLSEVNIRSGTNVGAICDEAGGTTKIYNCGILSGSVTGSNNVGGLVGLIKSGSSVRVVNCYNYADVTGGNYAAGIVGKNEGTVASDKTVGNVRIALCMMYGSVSGATHISPVYGGNHVNNVQNFTEYNYYLYSNKRNETTNERIVKVPYTTVGGVSDYNDQMAIDKDDYLTRYPFYRHIMNSHRKLAAFFLFGDVSSNDAGTISDDNISEIGHWSIGLANNPYPIVEKWRTNTSKVLDAPAGTTVSVRDGDGSAITSLSVSVIIGGHTYSATLPITDMDETNNDYTWGKVVLPFANEFEVNTDYTKVCTGWKITGVTGGKGGGYNNYNVSDRDCTSKDLFTTTGFIFAQGGNYIVPYNVTAITIEANFAKAYYLSDATYDVGYNASYDGATGLGGNVPEFFHGQLVYNSLTSALADMGSNATPHSQAIVLVGNYHYRLAKTDLDSYLANGLTIMSIDEDNNQEPDYGWYSCNVADRPNMPPVRFDFLPMIPLGMAAHVTGSKGYPGVPIWKTRGWFEMTETSLCMMNQFELDSGNFNTSDSDRKNYRCIINGGYFTQMVRSNDGACTKVSYYQIGGNAYIKEFYPGNHSKRKHANPLVPINVTGGEIEECFMTGYKSDGTVTGGNIYFWCAGGKIHKFLGAYMEKPSATTVNMTAKIDHALIGRFFGGGTSPNASITGAINVTINNSKVDFYCGGPEFSSLTAKPTVRTSATKTEFGEYYGAGFGGTSVTYYSDIDNGAVNFDAATTTYPDYFTTYYLHTTEGRLQYRSNYGIGTSYKFEYLYHSAQQCGVARHFTGYAQFSLATTGNVTNELNNCKIKKFSASETVLGKEATKGDFYGAGCQGMVDGTVTSTLTGCEVDGSAYGGGYQATSNEVEVYPTTAPTRSVFTKETGLFSEFGKVTPNVFTWVQGTNANENTADEQGGKLYTSKNITMTNLGNVTGDISITIDGGTVTNDVFGGGNESKSLSDTSVTLAGNANIGRDVFGGGNKAPVSGSATVNIE